MQLLPRMFATSVEVIFAVGSVFVNSVYLSAIMMTSWPQSLGLGSGPKLSMRTNARGPAGEKQFNILSSLSFISIRRHAVQLLTTL